MHRIARLVPGLALSLTAALLATAAARLEHSLFGRAAIEALVLAILGGAAWRTAGLVPSAADPGIGFAARYVLEAAVALLGAGFDARPFLAAGPALAAVILGVVGLSLAGSFAVCRALALPWRMTALLACGNAICGNSAVAAVAPAIGAGSEDVAAAIGFTAAFGVASVLVLPPLGAALHLSPFRYGVLTGLAVYAVPQVLAAAAPMGGIAVQTATLVKLTRVLLLGPLSAAFAAAAARRRPPGAAPAPLLPWFIAVFAVLLLARSCGLVPPALGHLCATAAGLLTLVAMAGLGLATDLRRVARSGPVVVGAAALCALWLLALACLAATLLRR